MTNQADISATIMRDTASNTDKKDETVGEETEPGKSNEESSPDDIQEEEEEGEGEGDKSKKKRRLVVLKEHIVVTPGDPPTYHCGVCNKSFHLRSVARYHNYCGAPPGDKPYKCELCGQGFVTSGHFSYHMKSHTGLLPFNCEICNRSFKQLVKLKRHQKSHTGERPFKCDQCSRVFSAKHVLKEHAFTHSGEKPYTCNKCNKAFNHMSSLRKHKISHSESFSYTCEDCGKTFKMSWNLALHKKTHQPDRVHSCGVCNSAFRLASDLKRHSLIHREDVALWKCEICFATFRRRDIWVRHTKNLHPQPAEGTSEPAEAPAKAAAKAAAKATAKATAKAALPRQLSCCTATPSLKPSNALAEESAASPARSHPVPVICSTGRAPQTRQTNENYVSTITKATHIVRKDESGVPKVHTIITTTPLDAEITAGGSVTRAGVEHQYYSVPESLAIAKPPSGRASVLRHSNMGVILYCGKSQSADVPNHAAPPQETTQDWRPKVIMSNDK